MAKKPFLRLEMDKLPKMSKEDWILVILADDKKVRPRECAVLMNEVFFFSKELLLQMEEEFGFRGTGFGPFSQGVIAGIDKMVSDNMLEISKDRNTEINYYSLTEKGNARCESLLKKIPERELGRIRFAQFLAQRMGNMGTLQYLSSVHPEYVFIRMAGDAPV